MCQHRTTLISSVEACSTAFRRPRDFNHGQVGPLCAKTINQHNKFPHLPANILIQLCGNTISDGIFKHNTKHVAASGNTWAFFQSSFLGLLIVDGSTMARRDWNPQDTRLIFRFALYEMTAFRSLQRKYHTEMECLWCSFGCYLKVTCILCT